MWFCSSREEAFRKAAAQRRLLAERLRTTNILHALPDVNQGFAAASDALRNFPATFGEPPPVQVETALRLEIILWRRVQATLERERELVPSQERDLNDRLRAALLILTNVIHAEEEMITNCLTTHYLTITRTLGSEAARITLW